MSAIETTIQDVMGGPPFNGKDGLVITSDTRPALRTWLQRLGWKGDVVMTLTLDELGDCYAGSERCADVAAAKGCPTLSQPQALEAARAPYAPRNKDLVAYLERRGPVAAQPQPATLPTFPAAPTLAEERRILGLDADRELPLPPPSPELARAQKAAELAKLLADMAGTAEAKLDETRVIELIREHAPATIVRHVVTIETREPKPARDLPDVPRHRVFPEVLAAVSAGLNVMLVGPAGAGKTHLGEQVAEALSLEFHFTGALDSPYKLLGFIDAQGRTVRTPYRDAYEHGKLFMFDEIDASTPGALLCFNAGLSNHQQDFPDACVRRHANFRAIASANTYGRGQDRVYVGRNQLDAASLDRFAVIAMDYDEELEAALYGSTPWLARVHKVRAAVARLNIRHVVSMRAIDQGNRLLAAGLTQDRVEALALWKGLDTATVDKIKAEAR